MSERDGRERLARDLHCGAYRLVPPHSSLAGIESPLHPSLPSLGPCCLDRIRNLPSHLLTSRPLPKLGEKNCGRAQHHQQRQTWDTFLLDPVEMISRSSLRPARKGI